MADHTIVLESESFDPESTNVEIDDTVFFRLGGDRREDVVSILQGGQPSTTLFGTSAITVGLDPVSERVASTASGEYVIEAPTEASPLSDGKTVMTGTIKVGGRLAEKAL